ncbi:hypothetical protein COL05_08780 [Bacillus sp. AFS059628]|nr:hypothetical protein COL05_08780 [Bacillus sp. AFS059628]
MLKKEYKIILSFIKGKEKSTPFQKVLKHFMYIEQLKWLLLVPCAKSIHSPPIDFAFLEEGFFLAKMIKKCIFLRKN